MNPNLPDMANKNKANIMYIGQYSGAGSTIAKNKDMKHGLFGKYNGRDSGDIESIKNAATYVKLKTQKGTNMYRGIISLEEKEALKHGFDNRMEWESFIQQQIFSMADKIDIPASRLEYVCAVHMQRGHPHMHFTMWDKNQGLKKAYVHESISNSIRCDINKAFYQEELAELYIVKNNSRDDLTCSTKDFFKDFFDPIQNMTKKELDMLVGELQQNPDHAAGQIFDSKVTDETLENIGLRIIRFREKLPKSGHITYKTLTPDLKEELKGIVKDIINSNASFSRELEIYIDTNVELVSFYSAKKNLKTEQEKAAKSAEEDVLKRLSNQLLKEIKEINNRLYENQEKEYQNNQTERWQEQTRYHTFMIIKNLFSFFSRIAESEQRRGSSFNRRKDELSKQAKKELAIKLEHKSSIDWER